MRPCEAAAMVGERISLHDANRWQVVVFHRFDPSVACTVGQPSNHRGCPLEQVADSLARGIVGALHSSARYTREMGESESEMSCPCWAEERRVVVPRSGLLCRG